MTQIAAQEDKVKTSQQPDPSKIMQIGMGFWASKVLLTAVKFKLFTLLSGTSFSGKEVKDKLGLKTTDRHVYDWLDCLVSLGFLQRDGIYENALYCNATETDLFLDKNKPSYIGGILEMGNNRLYKFWDDLEEGLKSGLRQNESKSGTNMDFFIDLYKSPERLHLPQERHTGRTGNHTADGFAVIVSPARGLTGLPPLNRVTELAGWVTAALAPMTPHNGS